MVTDDLIGLTPTDRAPDAQLAAFETKQRAEAEWASMVREDDSPWFHFRPLPNGMVGPVRSILWRVEHELNEALAGSGVEVRILLRETEAGA